MSDNEMKPTMKRKPSGILKSDIPKNRKPSGLSIDVKTQKALDHEVCIVINIRRDNIQRGFRRFVDNIM